MSFDPLVANPGRLQILTALAVKERQEFVHLRRATRLTDGNLAAHAKRLQGGGLIAIEKQFRDGKPVTHLTLTPAGRLALENHVRRVLAAITSRPEDAAGTDPAATEAAQAAAVPVEADAPEDDWVD